MLKIRAPPSCFSGSAQVLLTWWQQDKGWGGLNWDIPCPSAFGLTHCPWPLLLFQPLWMGSTMAEAWMVSPHAKGQGRNLPIPGSSSSQALGSLRREDRESTEGGGSPGHIGKEVFSLYPDSLQEVGEMWAPGNRDLYPSAPFCFQLPRHLPPLALWMLLTLLLPSSCHWWQ